MEVTALMDVVQMIFNRIKYTEDTIDFTDNQETKTFYLGYKQALLDLSEHLQNGIEAKLNAEELT